MKPVSKKSTKKPTKQSEPKRAQIFLEEPKMVRIRLTMDKDLYDQAKAEADKLGISFSKFVERAIRQYIKINR
jgi:predicted HicB family RNase H-like nuclease